MRIDRTTITRHIGDETLTCRIKGKGRIKRRRVFTRFDVEAFLQALAETAAQCPSNGQKESLLPIRVIDQPLSTFRLD
ncbi:hypothetical protein QA639_33780 [Bradyrhizobium pachyrhizi]|uniref:hypothetical protein n=1 Tax=Bradyrhizobium pachyrhizi TaxID=280333 RepID=UPI0024B246BE|nr:hypothetical protein [Bradyrhizobium pachyrhizi]WFU54531.1 hypothetical protein QA639_33780 [Bradyrhizobium pachyrhizi]